MTRNVNSVFQIRFDKENLKLNCNKMFHYSCIRHLYPLTIIDNSIPMVKYITAYTNTLMH